MFCFLLEEATDEPSVFSLANVQGFAESWAGGWGFLSGYFATNCQHHLYTSLKSQTILAKPAQITTVSSHLHTHLIRYVLCARTPQKDVWWRFLFDEGLQVVKIWHGVFLWCYLFEPYTSKCYFRILGGDYFFLQVATFWTKHGDSSAGCSSALGLIVGKRGNKWQLFGQLYSMTYQNIRRCRNKKHIFLVFYHLKVLWLQDLLETAESQAKETSVVLEHAAP